MEENKIDAAVEAVEEAVEAVETANEAVEIAEEAVQDLADEVAAEEEGEAIVVDAAPEE